MRCLGHFNTVGMKHSPDEIEGEELANSRRVPPRSICAIMAPPCACVIEKNRENTFIGLTDVYLIRWIGIMINCPLLNRQSVNILAREGNIWLPTVRNPCSRPNLKKSVSLHVFH